MAAGHQECLWLSVKYFANIPKMSMDSTALSMHYYVISDKGR